MWIYDAQTGSIISLLKGERQNILDVAFSENGNNCDSVQMHFGQILKWHAKNGELISILSNEKAVYFASAIFTTDGSKVYGIGGVEDQDEKLYVWELND